MNYRPGKKANEEVFPSYDKAMEEYTRDVGKIIREALKKSESHAISGEVKTE